MLHATFSPILKSAGDKMNYTTMRLRSLVERIIDGDEFAKAEFERRWEIPWEQVGTVPICREEKCLQD
ncbi:hypothetical protein FGG79_20850 [Bacillus sp. BHET2]|nr:hypothetical protein FGG79_20850 [Bacillus sp. BHET2]